MPDTYSSPEKAERPQSDLKIVAMHTFDTDSAISTYGRLPLSLARRYISTKQGRSTNDRPKYQRAKQNTCFNPRKSTGYLQVPREYLQTYLRVPTGTHTDTPARGTHFRYRITNNYAAPEAAQAYIMASTDPCPTRDMTKSTHLPRMQAPEGN